MFSYVEGRKANHRQVVDGTQTLQGGLAHVESRGASAPAQRSEARAPMWIGQRQKRPTYSTKRLVLAIVFAHCNCGLVISGFGTAVFGIRGAPGAGS